MYINTGRVTSREPNKFKLFDPAGLWAIVKPGALSLPSSLKSLSFDEKALTMLSHAAINSAAQSCFMMIQDDISFPPNFHFFFLGSSPAHTSQLWMGRKDGVSVQLLLLLPLLLCLSSVAAIVAADLPTPDLEKREDGSLVLHSDLTLVMPLSANSSLTVSVVELFDLVEALTATLSSMKAKYHSLRSEVRVSYVLSCLVWKQVLPKSLFRIRTYQTRWALARPSI